MRWWDIISYPFRRTPRRPLHARMPSRDEMGQTQSGTPLGMEATDLSLIERVARRNDALERTSTIAMNKERSHLQGSSSHVTAMPDDETYVARFYRAFQKKGNT